MGMPPSVAVSTLAKEALGATKKRPSHRLLDRFSRGCCVKNTHNSRSRTLAQDAIRPTWSRKIFYLQINILVRKLYYRTYANQGWHYTLR